MKYWLLLVPCVECVYDTCILKAHDSPQLMERVPMGIRTTAVGSVARQKDTVWYFRVLCCTHLKGLYIAPKGLCRR